MTGDFKVSALLYRRGSWFLPWGTARGCLALRARRRPLRADRGTSTRKRLADRPCFPVPVCWQLERARSEAGEALSALRRLQRRVSELEEESRLQDADVSGASLQSELAHSLDGDQDHHTDRRGDAPVSARPTSPQAAHPGGCKLPLFPSL